MEYKFTIYGTLPGLNDYTRTCRSNKFAGGAMKSKTENEVAKMIQIAKLQHSLPSKPIETPVWLDYVWYEPSNRRDADNVVFGQKFIQDALVCSNILPDDSRKYIVGFSHKVLTDKENPRIEITIRDNV